MSLRFSIVLAATLLVACGGERGVGLGQVGYGGSGTLPQSTRTEVEMIGLEHLPLYRFQGEASPLNAATLGGSPLRRADANVIVEVNGNTYAMRQIEISGSNYAVVEGAAPIADLPRVIRARTGCLVESRPIQAKAASVYVLDCS